MYQASWWGDDLTDRRHLRSGPARNSLDTSGPPALYLLAFDTNRRAHFRTGTTIDFRDLDIPPAKETVYLAPHVSQGFLLPLIQVHEVLEARTKPIVSVAKRNNLPPRMTRKIIALVPCIPRFFGFDVLPQAIWIRVIFL